MEYTEPREITFDKSFPLRVGVGAQDPLRARFTLDNGGNMWFLDLKCKGELFGEIVYDPAQNGVRGFGLFNGTYLAIENTDEDGSPMLMFSHLGRWGYNCAEIKTHSTSDPSVKFDMHIVSSGEILLMTTNDDPVRIDGIQVFANNSEAIAGGLTLGSLYRTGGDPDHLCIVH
jgi:hypothetical protein